MAAQQFYVDVIAHNLANVNTVAFKKMRPEFQDLIYLNLRSPVAAGQGAPIGLTVGMGVRTVGTQTIFQQGNLQQTENPLDLALNGPGFFVVRGAEGAFFYTRDGSFKLDAEGRLVTSDGFFVQGEGNKDLQLPKGAQDILIGRDGTITCREPGKEEPREVGKLALVQFPNPAGLERVGRNLYRATPASGDPVQVGKDKGAPVTVEQGFLESANVQVVEEMVDLITAQRAYELNSKVVQAADEILSLANNIRR